MEKTTLSTILSWACVLVLSGACACSSAPPQPQGIAQRVVFEIEYLNYAWGYRHRGVYVDNAGKVYEYDRKGAQWSGNGASVFSEEDLMGKFGDAQALPISVAQAKLLEMFALGASQNAESLAKPTQTCADAGTVSFWAYRYDPASNPQKPYSRALITRAGDVTQKNQTESGRALFEWLRSLDDKYSQLPCFD